MRNANNLSIIETSNHEILATDYRAGIFYYTEGSDEFRLSTMIWVRIRYFLFIGYFMKMNLKDYGLEEKIRH